MEKIGKAIAETLDLWGNPNSTPNKIKPEDDYCVLCDNTGWIPKPDDELHRVMACECKKRKQEAARLAQIMREWPEYADIELDTIKARSIGQENAIIKLREAPAASYYFTGLFKRGKTALMIAQYRKLSMECKPAILRSARDLMEELRRSEVPASNDKEVVPSALLQLVNFGTAGHIFIDDVDKIAGTNFRTEMLWDILDTIKRRKLSLSMTSNLPLLLTPEQRAELQKQGKEAVDLRDKLGTSIVSRIYQICSVIEI